MIYVKVNSSIWPIQFKSVLTLLSLIGLVISFQVATAASEPFHHKFGELREYHKHWLAVCPDAYVPNSKSDYSNFCWAVTHSGKNGFFLDNRLAVYRNRQSGQIKISFLFDAYDRIDKKQPISARFSNGEVMKFEFGRSARQHDSINEFVIAADNPDEMLKVMKVSNWMQLSVPTTTQTEVINYSMIGVAAAMKFAEKYALLSGN